MRVVSALGWSVLFTLTGGSAFSAALPPDGSIVRFENREAIRFAVPEPFHELVLDGNPELEIEVGASRRYAPPPAYQRASAVCTNTLDASGVRAGSTGGQPFPDSEWARALAPPECHLALDDAELGTKLAWNMNDRWQGAGLRAEAFGISGVSPEDGSELVAFGEYRRGYTGTRTQVTVPRVLADHTVSTEWREAFSISMPFQLRGTTFRRWRHEAAEKHDHMWIYIPSLRRVRRLPVEKHWEDLLGSTLSPNDFLVFSGRVVDYEWRALGRREVLVPIGARDCFAGGGDEAWTRCAYAPHGAMAFGGAQRFEVREVWELEAEPRIAGDSRRRIWVDRETYIPVYSVSYSGRQPVRFTTAIFAYDEEGALLLPKAISVFDQAKGRASVAQFYASKTETLTNSEITKYFQMRLACIAEGTAIDTPSGPVPIETLKVGDHVMAYDFTRRERVSTRVAEIHSRIADETFELLPGLRLTTDHPVYADGSWVPAEDVAAGATLLSFGGSDTRAEPRPLAYGPITVFDITTTGPHNFFAGGALVHNKGR